MAVPIIITHVSAEGTLNTQVRRQVATLLRGMAGRTVQIRVGLHKSPRSVPQNKRYWAMLQAAADSLGYDTTEELHEACAWHLLREPDDQRVGVTPRRQRTPRRDSSHACISFSRKPTALSESRYFFGNPGILSRRHSVEMLRLKMRVTSAGRRSRDESDVGTDRSTWTSLCVAASSAIPSVPGSFQPCNDPDSDPDLST